MGKLFKSKTGQEGKGITMTDEWVLVVILSFVIPITAMIFAVFVTGFQIKSNTYMADVEDTIIQTRFFNNPDCFAYQDPDTGRVYPGIIDIRKFNQAIMDSCYSVPKNYLSGYFRLELKDIDRNQEYTPVESANFGENYIRQGSEKEPFLVLIKDGDTLQSGIIYVQSSNK
ncbi:MAG: hypothetical protein KKE20_04140 [Nanoarchaeota archaeon]|nr:hypothetical protein [Nanoarchaeota archaeon]